VKRMTDADLLLQRLSRPQRIGVLGHRGVGKTTLLTMLYREAVSGRWPDLRLAAADARTAQFLSDKITQWESGQPLPATLAETDLRFHLYHDGKCLDLLFKDYQGEHVELGRDEPIRSFLRDCDAVWLCLDAGILGNSTELLKRQQEMEQVIEDYLTCEPFPNLHRPMSLLLTKSDLLDEDHTATHQEWAGRIPLARHALEAHCPSRGFFAVSSLGQAPASNSSNYLQNYESGKQSIHVDEPLRWLVDVLQVQDEARLEKLWTLSPNQASLLQRAGAVVSRRYPRSTSAAKHAERIKSLVRGQRRRRVLAIAGTAACLVGGLWTYDAVAHARTIQFEKEHADAPSEALQAWNAYQAWHPTRNLLNSSGQREEEQRVKELAANARRQDLAERLADWRKHAVRNEDDPQEVWQLLETIKRDYPEAELEGDLATLQAQVQARRHNQLERRADRAFEDLVAREGNKADLSALRDRSDRFLKDFPGTSHEAEVRKRRDAIRSRLEDNELQVARAYSAEHPLNFQTRKEHYLAYLANHPNGSLRSHADAAIKAIDLEWDKHDFRPVRDMYASNPENVEELTRRCQFYVALHPEGRFLASAKEVLRWCEQVSSTREYRVVLKSGKFDRRTAFWLSRGPDLSVEIEVNAIRYGPSPVIANRYDPEWNYEFPRKIRWKLGDSVRIRVYDHDYWKHLVVYFCFDGDPLGIRQLSDVVDTGKNALTFESDFQMPKLPRVEDE
jgi:hypothetical protein